MQSRTKITRTKQDARNGKTRLVGHLHEGDPMAGLFALLSEGKEGKVDGLSEALAKGTTGSLRSLKRDANSIGKWILVRKPRGVRLVIRERKRTVTSANSQSRAAASQ